MHFLTSYFSRQKHDFAHWTKYYYDTTNNLIRTEQTGSDGTFIMAEHDIDPVGNVFISTDAEGKISRYAYNEVNRLEKVTNPANEITRFEYDANGRRTKTILPNGQKLVFGYDVAGQLTYTDGGPEGRKDFIYDDLGRNTEVKDANNRTRITNYDALSRVTSQLNEMGQPVSYGYDIAGRRTSLTDANGNTTRYDYNEDNQLVKMTYPSVAGEEENIEEYEYNTAGQLISKLTPNGDEIGYSYNIDGQLASVTFGERTVVYTRDLAGAVTSIGGTGDVTTMNYVYNDLGRVKSVTDTALSKTINYGYNLNGMRTSLSLDATNIGYTYDDAGRLKTVTKDSDAPAEYDYDTTGRRKSLKLPNGVETTYGYTANSQLLNLSTTNPTETLASFDYTVDSTGNRDKIEYADGSSSNYTYDGAYRLISETRKKADGSLEYEIAFSYDAVGNRLTKKSTNAVEYAADADTQGLWHFEEPVVDGAITIKDASGNDNTLTGGSGLSTTDGRFGKAINFEGGYLTAGDSANLELYNEDFTLEAWVKLDALTGTQVIAQKWDEVNDARSFRLSLVEGIPQLELTADGTGDNVYIVSSIEAIETEVWTHIAAIRAGENVKLLVNKIEVAITPFTGSVFDGAADVIVGFGLDGIIDEIRSSNANKETALSKVATLYAYNAYNQLVTETTGTTIKSYTYDKNGNNIGTETKIETTAITTESMTYDELNRMLTYTGPRGTESFSYQGAGWQRYTAAGKTFLYDGPDVLADIEAGIISALYVTPGVDQNLSITQSAITYYYTQDGMNSINTLTDTSGSILNSYDYLPYGGQYAPRTIKNSKQRYTYTGREENAILPLMYYRNRNYNTNIGRFGTRDPMGYLGDYSIYNYVRSRPTVMYDPTGLWGKDVHINLVKDLAEKAGIPCAAELAAHANAPDEDWRNPEVAFTLAMLLKAATVSKKAGVGLSMAFILASRLWISKVAEWHFPVNHGVVWGGNPASKVKVENGLENCNLKEFGEGLHTYQDSWSHRGRPYIEGVGHGIGATEVEAIIRNKAAKEKLDYIRLQAEINNLTHLLPEQITHIGNKEAYWKKIYKLEAALSSSTDNVDVFPEQANAAARATYNMLARLSKKCPNICGINTCTKTPQDGGDVSKWIDRKYKDKDKVNITAIDLGIKFDRNDIIP